MITKNILLTGTPGCGKTTIIKKVLEKVKGVKTGGFYTQEVRKGKERMGFKIISLDGQEAVMAHVKFKGPYKVSKYKVDIDAVEDIGANAVLKAKENADLIVIDEIGKMELYSELFQLAVAGAVESEKKVLGTIMEHDNEFTGRLKERTDTLVLEVNKENRNALVDEIIAYLAF